MELIAAFPASLTAFPPNWDRSKSAGPDSRVLSRSMIYNNRIQRRLPMMTTSRKDNFFSRKCTAIRASIQPSDASRSKVPIAPLKLKSSVGQFLSEMLVSHPHYVAAAVKMQLDQLQIDHNNEQEKKKSFPSNELALYGRIDEVKANERSMVLEEILYALLVLKFLNTEAQLIPSITMLSPYNYVRAAYPLSQDDRLDELHSPEAYEMVMNHLILVLGNGLGGSNSVMEIGKLRLGQIYAASAMYGYFLRRVDQRFQLEKKMLLHGKNNLERAEEHPIGNGDHPHPEMFSWSDTGFFRGIKETRLRSFVMSFDGETLKRYESIRSKEAVNIIERQTEALFGEPQSWDDERMKISFGWMRRLVLEAVTFGSLLWDGESFVYSRCDFLKLSTL